MLEPTPMPTPDACVRLDKDYGYFPNPYSNCLLAEIGSLTNSPENVNNGQMAREALIGSSLPTSESVYTPPPVPWYQSQDVKGLAPWIGLGLLGVLVLCVVALTIVKLARR